MSFEWLLKLGAAGILGALLGLAAVAWIAPTTKPGAVLVLLVFTGLGIAVGSLVDRLTGSGKKDADQDDG